MIRIVLMSPGFGKVDTPDGKHALVFTDPQTQIEVVIPCESDDLTKMQSVLSGVEIAVPKISLP